VKPRQQQQLRIAGDDIRALAFSHGQRWQRGVDGRLVW